MSCPNDARARTERGSCQSRNVTNAVFCLFIPNLALWHWGWPWCATVLLAFRRRNLCQPTNPIFVNHVFPSSSNLVVVSCLAALPGAEAAMVCCAVPTMLLAVRRGKGSVNQGTLSIITACRLAHHSAGAGCGVQLLCWRSEEETVGNRMILSLFNQRTLSLITPSTLSLLTWRLWCRGWVWCATALPASRRRTLWWSSMGRCTRRTAGSRRRTRSAACRRRRSHPSFTISCWRDPR
jgi:hypothetical protein